MTGLDVQLESERSARQLQYVLLSITTRWRLIGLAIVLLLLVSVIGIVRLSLAYIGGFAVIFFGANYAMLRFVQASAFRPWYAHLNLAIGSAMISAVMYGMGAAGASLTEDESFQFSQLRRTADGLFVKASYLFRF